MLSTLGREELDFLLYLLLDFLFHTIINIFFQKLSDFVTRVQSEEDSFNPFN